MNTIEELKLLMMEIDDVRETDKTLKERKKALREREEEMYIRLQNEGLMKVAVEHPISGKTFTLFPNLNRRFYLQAEKKEEATAWLKETGFEDLFKETINSNTLTAAMKEFIEQDGEIPEELIGEIQTKRIGMRRS
jgi:hypothetical protein